MLRLRSCLISKAIAPRWWEHRHCLHLRCSVVQETNINMNQSASHLNLLLTCPKRPKNVKPEQLFCSQNPPPFTPCWSPTTRLAPQTATFASFRRTLASSCWRPSFSLQVTREPPPRQRPKSSTRGPCVGPDKVFRRELHRESYTGDSA